MHSRSRLDLTAAEWTLTVTNGPVPFPVEDVPATVPGTFLTDLLSAGLIEDPYLDENEKDLAWSGECDLVYRTDFEADAELLAADRVDLVAQSLDTAATIVLNGRVIAQTQNQFRSWRFDATDVLREGANTLEIRLDAPLRVARENQKVLGDLPYVGNALPYNAIRKMACNMGWDWGPVLVTSGIAGPIGLEAWSGGRLGQVRPQVTATLPEEADSTVGGCPLDPRNPVPADLGNEPVGTVDVTVDVERTRASESGGSLIGRLRVTDPSGTVVAETEDPVTESTLTQSARIPDPDLWWPRGYGRQPLYTVDVLLESSDGGNPVVLDHISHRVGFRSAGFVETPDAIGATFTMTVNGQPILVKGANWIPDDALYTRQTRETYRRGVSDAVDAGMNMLRVWGGGLYESEDFYDACDEQGILVWQDFATACAAYSELEPLRSEFEAEAREHIVRLAWHPALAHWNGSNENVEGYWYWGWKDQIPEGTGWGNGYYTELFPALLAELDPTRSYSPSSPYSQAEPDDPHDVRYGTIHNWNVWGNKEDNNYVHYRDSVPRFSAEFGFQGPASRATVGRAVTERPLQADSAAMLNHQKAIGGQHLLTLGYGPHFPEPTSFEDFWFTTALNQARALKVGIGHYRSHWPEAGGTIVWQLNDCWPVTSWAAVDGDQRRKLLWYALRNMYRDVLVTIQPRENGPVVAIGNDTERALEGELHLRRITFDGAVLSEEVSPVRVEPRGTLLAPIPTHLAASEDTTREVLVADLEPWTTDGAEAAGNEADAGAPSVTADARAVWFFAEDKDLHLDPAALTIRPQPAEDGVDIELAAETLVRDVCVIADSVHPDAVSNRQMITLLPGETATVHVGINPREASGSATGTAAPKDVPATLAPEAFLASGIIRHVGELVRQVQ